MFRKTIMWLFILLTIVNSQTKAQQLINDKIDVIAGSGQFFFNCVIYKPANFSTTKKYPLVLFFHGMGEAGTDVNKMYRAGLPKVLKDGYKPPFDFIMVAPQHNSYSLDPKHLEQVLNESLIKFPNIDQTRIYLTGLSAGGNTIYVSSLNISPELPKKFAGMVVMSGATQGINKANFPWWQQFRSPLWAVVGENDPSYVGQNEYVVNEVNKQVSGLASLTVRPGIGHGGWNDVYNGTVKTKDGKNMWEYLYQFSRVNGNIVTGTGSVTSPTAPSNVAPSANAGPDKSITLPTSSVQLNGSGTDADGSISTYTWSKVSGPAQFSFSSTTVASPTVSNLAEGSYIFRLTVKDNAGTTDTDDVVVTVNGATVTPTPTPTGSKMVKVNLFGGSYAYSSTEWNNWNTNSSRTSANFKYNDGSSSSIKAVISAQNAVSDNSSTYSTTMAPKEVGRYASYSNVNRTLTISGLDNSKTYNLELYASRKGISNNTTRFTAGGRTIDVKTDDNLDQKASFTSVAPVNGQIVVSLTKLNTYNYLNGFMLSESGSSTSSSSQTAPSNSAPVVNAGSDKSLTLPTNSTQLSGTASDADGSVTNYSWSKVAGPGQYTLSSTSVASPSLSNLVEGTYTFRLTVTDNGGITASDDVNVYVNGDATSSSTPVSTQEIRVNFFGGSNGYTNTQWNNWNTYSSLSSSTFKYSDGTSSGVSASLSTQSAVSDNSSSYSITMAPKEVGRYASYSNSNRTLTISGLDNSRTYTLELYASRNGISNNTTRFTVGTTTKDVKTDNNLDEKAIFTVTPVNGKITVSIAKLNSYNYINGFILK